MASNRVIRSGFFTVLSDPSNLSLLFIPYLLRMKELTDRRVFLPGDARQRI